MNNEMSVEAKLDLILEKVTSLDAKVTSLDAKVTSLDAKVTSLDAKVASLGGKVTSLEAKVDSLEAKVDSLEAKVDSLEVAVQALQVSVSSLEKRTEGLETRMTNVEAKQDETIAAFRAHYGDMANLYRHMRDDLARFELRVEGKLSQVNQSIAALKDSIDRQDFRSDELGRRISRLEEQPRHPI